LEALASGSALDELAAAAAGAHPDSALGRMLVERGEVGGREAVQAAQQGDEVALGVIDLLGQRLGIGIANAINTFDPFEVVIGGGASAAGELLLAPARETAARYTVPGVGTRTVIRLARHGADAGVHGAALMAAHEEEQS
jgi:glucokinase